MITGLHHISLKCGTPEEFEKAKVFYMELLGFEKVREWPDGIMIGFGNGMLEIFSNGSGIKTKGALRHMAFATDDVEEIVDKIKSAGWWLLPALIPFAGQIYMMLWFLKDSQPGENQYGPNPKGL
jgi:glyoxylase I family protein